MPKSNVGNYYDVIADLAQTVCERKGYSKCCIETKTNSTGLSLIEVSFGKPDSLNRVVRAQGETVVEAMLLVIIRLSVFAEITITEG